MRQKFTVWTAVCLCFALTFGVTSAVERERDYTGNGSKDRMINGEQAGQVDVIDMQQTFADQTRRVGFQTRVQDGTGLRKASTLLHAAADQSGSEQIATLNQVLSMDLGSSAEAEKIQYEAYRLLGLAYEHPQKQVLAFAQALQFAPSPAQRQDLENRIAALGGNIVDIAFNGGAQAFAGRTPGVGDTCDAATAIAVGGSSNLSITEAGDVDFYAVDVNEASGGALLSISTTNDDPPGSFIEDTDLTLWSACNAGVAEGQLGFDDDGGVDFLSMLDTDCLPNGTYYIEVGGWADIATAFDVDLNVDLIASCEPPTPDDFEPDNDAENATRIGRLVSGNPFGLFKGTIRKEIQAHNFFPPGDTDWVKFKILRNELVTMETRCQFPTVFNDFAECDVDGNDVVDPDPDTVLNLWAQSPFDYGGLCNNTNGAGSVTPLILCRDDLDCDLDGDGDPLNDLVNPIAGFPPCLDWELFSSPFGDGAPPLAFNDDISFPSQVNSRLTVCMPSGIRAISGSALVQNDSSGGGIYEWFVQLNPFDAADVFDYEIWVRNDTTCLFEQEPNQDFEDANPMPVDGRSIHGFSDFTETFPAFDADLYEFDVDERGGFDGTDRLVTFETKGFDNGIVDTFLELLVGPDPNGLYYFTGVQDEDGGENFLSRIDVVLPTADSLLGVTLPPDVQEACDNPPPGAPWWWPSFLPWWGDFIPQPEYCGPSYFMNVTSRYLNPAYPYELAIDFPAPPIDESEPNDDDASANSGAIGDTFNASIDPTCDYDTFSFTLTEDTEVSIGTLGSGDTAIELTECGDPTVIACDDDNGAGLLSLIEGCLPAGTYCAQVRAFSGTATFDYQLELGGGASCTAENPPVVSGDGAFTCLDWETCP